MSGELATHVANLQRENVRLKSALEQAEQHEAKWKRTEGWLNDKLTAAEARLASEPGLVEALNGIADWPVNDLALGPSRWAKEALAVWEQDG